MLGEQFSFKWPVSSSHKTSMIAPPCNESRHEVVCSTSPCSCMYLIEADDSNHQQTKTNKQTNKRFAWPLQPPYTRVSLAADNHKPGACLHLQKDLIEKKYKKKISAVKKQTKKVEVCAMFSASIHRSSTFSIPNRSEEVCLSTRLHIQSTFCPSVKTTSAQIQLSTCFDIHWHKSTASWSIWCLLAFPSAPMTSLN